MIPGLSHDCTFISAKDVNPSSIAAINKLSQNNEPPSPTELAALRAIADQLSTNISSCDAHGEALLAPMNKLTEQRQLMVDGLELCRALINPIRRLPHEVLAQIFDICVQNDCNTMRHHADYSDIGTFNTERAPWVLSQVSRKWRGLSTGMPRLWVYIDIGTIDNHDDLGDTRQLDALLSLQLQRCQNQLITVVFTIDKYFTEEGPTILRERLIAMLCSRSFQWERAIIGTSSDGLKTLSPYFGMFPNLSQLELCVSYPDPFVPGHVSDVDVFADAPKLRQITLTNHISLVWDCKPGIPWRQITHFECTSSPHADRGPDIRDLFMSLPHLPHLQVAYLETSSPANIENIFPDQPQLRLPYLHTLALRNHGGHHQLSNLPHGALHPLLEWLTLPSLKVLRCSSGFDCPSTLIQFLQRSQCILDELGLFDFDIPQDSLKSLFLHPTVHHLTTLRIGGSRKRYNDGPSDSILILLTLPPGPQNDAELSVTLHRLETLVLRDKKIWTDSALLKLIESRRNIETLGLPPGSVRQLRQVVFHNPCVKESELITDENVKRSLEDLKKDGFILQCINENDTETADTFWW